MNPKNGDFLPGKQKEFERKKIKISNELKKNQNQIKKMMKF